MSGSDVRRLAVTSSPKLSPDEIQGGIEVAGDRQQVRPVGQGLGELAGRHVAVGEHEVGA